ncbi:MAG: type I-G CRISPR-associated helicase/endonuclease Cas3g [Phycisphaerae bacterium]
MALGPSAAEKITVSVLMGGEDADDWDIYPERDAVIIGTQDMLLSRALNRGYAASRARWPMQFGLLNNDCLWVFDEIQLMGSGLATSAQLEAFRRLLPTADDDSAKAAHGCQSVWMSATLNANWLETVDFAPRVGSLKRLSLNEDDIKDRRVEKLRSATKPLANATARIGEMEELAKEVLLAHKPGTRTIVIANTVKRARELFGEIGKQSTSGKEAVAQPKLLLLHSRFRPGDRAKAVKDALAAPPADGTIIVSTQVVEAGVDTSATTLFTELAPWASMVQRFGRCNRRGEYNESASVKWIDLPAKKHDEDGFSNPYQLEDLKAARTRLLDMSNVGISHLPVVDVHFEHTHVIRRRDVVDLFDTTPDLVGNDIDIDRYVRDADDTDVRAFWRKFEGDPNGHDGEGQQTEPSRYELCPAPIGEFYKFVKANAKMVWRWNFLDKKWQNLGQDKIAPGQVYLVNSDAGGYTELLGWDPGIKKPSVPPTLEQMSASSDGYDDDDLSGVWRRIDEHTGEVCAELETILSAIQPAESGVLRAAARWHDLGKAHQVFQSALPAGAPKTGILWAKAVGRGKTYREVGRRHFRHELASALALLQRPHENLRDLSENLLNLVAYLIAAHHGKVRLSIRSLPSEKNPGDGRRFARGIWDGDVLPEADLGGGVHAQSVKISLEPMELGLCEVGPFTGQPSWAERMLRLRDLVGPFRLAYLEALLRSADMRASAAASKSTTEMEKGAVCA